MREVHTRHRRTVVQAKGDGGKQCTMSLGHCLKDKGDKCSPHTTTNYQCAQSTTNEASP